MQTSTTYEIKNAGDLSRLADHLRDHPEDMIVSGRVHLHSADLHHLHDMSGNGAIGGTLVSSGPDGSVFNNSAAVNVAQGEATGAEEAKKKGGRPKKSANVEAAQDATEAAFNPPATPAPLGGSLPEIDFKDVKPLVLAHLQATGGVTEDRVAEFLGRFGATKLSTASQDQLRQINQAATAAQTSSALD